MKKDDINYVFELEMKVRDYEVDYQQIVNNANYLHYLEHTRHEFCRWAGRDFHDLHYHGIDPVVRKVEIEYINSLRMGDTMVSKLALARKGPLFMFIQHIFKSDGTPVVRATVHIACLVDGKLTRGDVLFETYKDYMS